MLQEKEEIRLKKHYQNLRFDNEVLSLHSHISQKLGVEGRIFFCIPESVGVYQSEKKTDFMEIL